MAVVVWTNFACALLYAVLALLLLAHSTRRLTAWMLIAACSATALWALSVALETGLWVQRPMAQLLEVLRLGAWLGFLVLVRSAGHPEGAASRETRWWLGSVGVICTALVGLYLYGGKLASPPAEGLLVADLSGHLLLVTIGLLLVEAVLRETQLESRWRLKYLCIGVGGMLVYDLFLYSESLLFRRIDPILDASRGAVAAIAAPLVAVAAARNPSWSTQLDVSRRAVYHSAALVGVGIYVLALAGIGTLLGALEAEWAGVLQVTFIFAALMLLAALFFSGTIRTALKKQLSSYLFTHRHDYREQWRRFSAALSSSGRGRSLPERAFQAVAGTVDCEQGGLWLREGEVFARVAGYRLPRGASDEPTGGCFAQELTARGDRLLNLGDGSEGNTLRKAPWLPAWLQAWKSAWLLIPLIQRGFSIGFIVLARPGGRGALDREDRELLETVACHTASYLAEDQNTRALEEARRFEELSRGLAFMAHDLRNLANNLSLTLANARKHIQEPEFQQDMLLSMEESVAGMQRVLGRLRRRDPQAPTTASSDLTQLIGDSLRGHPSERPSVRLELGDGPLFVAGDPDRLVAVSGHLVQNAIDAAGPEGHVTVRLHRDGAASLLEVIDDGPGMSAEFLRERLLRPFGSSKPHGFGLGLYQCRESARELGGELAIESKPGRGTVARLRLPLLSGNTGGWEQEGRDAGE
jgi:putative PEP-CTERM system histidine kinase